MKTDPINENIKPRGYIISLSSSFDTKDLHCVQLVSMVAGAIKLVFRKNLTSFITSGPYHILSRMPDVTSLDEPSSS